MNPPPTLRMHSLRESARNSFILRRSLSSVLCQPSTAMYASLRSPKTSAVSALLGFAFFNCVLRLFLRVSASPRQISTRKPLMHPQARASLESQVLPLCAPALQTLVNGDTLDGQSDLCPPLAAQGQLP
jgi:hypothetical protein